MACTCEAYPFPHRPLGGQCDGAALWDAAFRDGWHCTDCPHAVEIVDCHPYGEGLALERTRECAAPGPHACPAVRERRAAA